MFFRKKSSAIQDAPSDSHSTVFIYLPTKSLFSGNLKSERSVRLECDFKGDIVTSGRVVLANEARVEGNIKCGSALISGQVKGNIYASDNLSLKVPAHIKGNILTREIDIEPGVIIDGVYKILEEKKD